MGRKRSLTVFLDPQDIKFLKDKSWENGRSLSGMIRHVVKEWIREEKTK